MPHLKHYPAQSWSHLNEGLQLAQLGSEEERPTALWRRGRLAVVQHAVREAPALVWLRRDLPHALLPWRHLRYSAAIASTHTRAICCASWWMACLHRCRSSPTEDVGKR